VAGHRHGDPDQGFVGVDPHAIEVEK